MDEEVTAALDAAEAALQSAQVHLARLREAVWDGRPLVEKKRHVGRAIGAAGVALDNLAVANGVLR